MGKRADDLKVTIEKMVGARSAAAFFESSGWQAASFASRRVLPGANPERAGKPSYMSARSFADSSIELFITARKEASNISEAIESLGDGPLKTRLQTLVSETDGELDKVKAGLENWFDDTMDRLQGAYKRWAQVMTLVFGLALAAGLNVSTVRIVDSLWGDATLRTAVADNASKLTEEPCTASSATAGTTTILPTTSAPTGVTTTQASASCSAAQKISGAIVELDELKIPLGWGAGWDKESGAWWTVVGFVPTGLAVLFGAQFWFDVLTRLTSARGSRGVPPKAAQDPLAASFLDESRTVAATESRRRTLDDLAPRMEPPPNLVERRSLE